MMNPSRAPISFRQYGVLGLAGTGMVVLLSVGGCGGQPAPSPVGDSSGETNSLSNGPAATAEPVSSASGRRTPRREPEQGSGGVAPKDTTDATDARNSGVSRGRAATAETSLQVRLPLVVPDLDESALAEHGIRAIRSQHLVLLTDVSTSDVDVIPALADRLYATLTQQLGPLRPAADGSDFQVIGCLIAAEERFREAGLLPSEGFTFRHGRHQGYRFWMYSPEAEYYRRHLALHEFVHCFMMCEHGMSDIPPLWFTEGIAEYFATHQTVPDDGTAEAVEFGILPRTTGALAGWGRISEIGRNFDRRPDSQFADAGIISLDAVLSPPDPSFVEDAQYANAWALCWLIRNHPALQPALAPLFRVRSGTEFQRTFSQIPKAALEQLRWEWLLFCESLTEGFDTARSFPVDALPLDAATESESALRIRADRGWHRTGLVLAENCSYEITCEGRFQMNDAPRPWLSEPQGITIDYHRGRPLGEIVAVLITTDHRMISRRIPIGRSAMLTSPVDVELWLQVNDSAADRANNAGDVVVRIQSR